MTNGKKESAIEERHLEKTLELIILERRRADEAERGELSWKLAEEAKGQSEIERWRVDTATHEIRQ